MAEESQSLRSGGDVEITREMIEAGATVLVQDFRFGDLDPITAEILVEEVLRAALPLSRACSPSPA